MTTATRYSTRSHAQYQLDRLQKIMNAAARITCRRLPRFCHITPTSIHLYTGFQFSSESILRLLSWYLKSGYLVDLMHVKSPKRRALRSDDHQLLDVPGTKCETFGDRALASAAPQGRDTLGDKSLQQFSLCDRLI